MGPKRDSPMAMVAKARKAKAKSEKRDRGQKVFLHDQGMDGGNIVRDIARTQLTAQSILGTPRPLSWLDIVRTLIHPTKPRYSAKVDLLDTVVCEHGVPEQYFATDPRSGSVFKKAKRLTKLQTMCKEFSRIALDSKTLAGSSNPFSDPNQNVNRTLVEDDWVAVILTRGGACNLVDYGLMKQFAKTALPADTIAILPYLEPKGGKPQSSSLYCNYRQEYKLDDVANPRMRHLRMNVNDDLNGIQSNPRSRVPSMAKPINRKMDQIVQTIVAAVEASTGCRVTKFFSEFVVDANDNVFMVRTTNCEISSEPNDAKAKKRSKSGQKKKRSEMYQTEAKNLKNTEEEMSLYQEGTHLPTSFDKESLGGHRVEERLDKRRKNKNKVDEVMVSRIMSEDNFSFAVGSPVRYAKAGRRAGTPQGLQSPLFPSESDDDAWGDGKDRPSSVASNISNPPPSRGHTAEAQRLADMNPKNRTKTKIEMNALTHSTSASAILGSTQMENSCKGDFCHYDILLHTKAQADLNGQKTKDSFMGSMGNVPISDLRQRLLEEERDSAYEMLGQLKKEKKTGKGGKKGSSSETGVDLGSEETFFELPLAAVLQARKEKHLVELLLRRHKKGEENIDYVGVEDGKDFNLGQAFPGHFYKPAKVCQCCFRVYNFIEAARNRSARKIEVAAAERKRQFAIAQRERKRKIAGKDTLFPPGGAEEMNATSSELAKQFLDGDGEAMLARAQAAIESITNNDVAEIRSFSSPPAAAKMVLTCMMIILRKKVLPWEKIKPIMSNGDRFLNEILDFDPENLTDKQYKDLEPYMRNPNFKPGKVAPVSIVAAKFCSWVLGVVNAYKCRKGLSHERVDVLAHDDFFNSGAALNTSLLSPDSKRNRQGVVAPMPSMQIAMQEVMKEELRGASDEDEDNLSFAEKLAKKKRIVELPNRGWSDLEKTKNKRKKRKSKPKTKNKVQASTRIGFGRGSAGNDDSLENRRRTNAKFLYNSDSDESIEPIEGSHEHKKRAKIAAQRRRMEELSGEGGATASGAAHERHTLLCADGLTRVPYEVIGKSEMEITKVNFVVCHDIFDSCDMTKMLFLSLVKRHPGCQILLFNYPGQAGTTYPNARSTSSSQVVPAGAEDEKPALNNDFIADRVHELIGHTDATGEFISSAQPFHFIGMGNGLPIALSFAEKYANLPQYANTLRSIVSINGFTTVDPQLAAILHSALNVFKSFPGDRPDLPVSYFTRFLFSDNYLSHVPRNLALNLYTAVTNPITLEGRVRLCAGALKHRDTRGILKNLKVPLVAMQSTENMLINASNVDNLLEGRNASHVWSHQLNMNVPEDKNCYNLKSLENLLGALNRKRGAMVVFVRAGHALSQENKRSVIDLLDVLACPTPAYTGVEVPEVLEANFQPTEKLLKAGNGGKKDKKGEKDKDDGEEKKEVKEAEAEEDYKPGEFLEDERDAAELEEAAMKAAEGTPVKPRAPPRNHFEKLEQELMEQIESEHKQMVEDANLMPEAEESFVEDTVYTTEGAPTGEFDSAIEEGEVYEKKLEAEAEKMSDELEQRKQREFETKEKKKRDQREKEREEERERERVSREEAEKAEKEALEAARSFADNKPSLPPPAITIPAGGQGENDMFSPIKPTKTSVCEEPSTRFYMQDLRGGEMDMKTDFSEPIKSATEPAMGMYGGFGQVAPQGDVKKPKQVPRVIPGLDIKKQEDMGGADSGFEEMFKQELLGKMKAEEDSRPGRADEIGGDSLPPRAQEMLNSGVPIQAIPPELLVPPPTDDQKAWRSWNKEPGPAARQRKLPSADETLKLDDELQRAHDKERSEREARLRKEEEESARMIMDIQKKQDERRRKYEEEDRKKLAKLEMEALARQAERAQQELQRRLEIQEAEEKLVKKGLAEPYQVEEGEPEPVWVMPPTFYEEQKDLPDAFVKQDTNLDEIFDGMEQDAAAARKLGITRIEEFDKVKAQMAQNQIDRNQKLRTLKADELQDLQDEMASKIQNIIRGRLGKNKAREVRKRLLEEVTKGSAVIKIQKCMRGYISKKRVLMMRQQEVMQLILGSSANLIQRVWRGYLGRCEYLGKVRLVSACFLQRVFRGMLGRKAAGMERERLEDMRRRANASIKIQATWKMKVAREEYRVLRIHLLASVEIQRLFRGLIGRKRVSRVRKWESTEPGADRLKLGLELINESKVAFERQGEEIDALHRAQEKAEARVSHIHAELRESEKELGILERELQDIDQIETDLQELTHEKKLMQMNVVGAVGISSTGAPVGEGATGGGGGGGGGGARGNTGSIALSREQERARQAELHSIEMAIHMKRAEREKKKQELESEFTLVFSEVERKKASLERLELAIADMESTRQRKDREFGRIQRNLMELLQEQKYELDSLREKGIELETATATSAAAAAATAAKAKEHEKQSAVMFNQQEELMKFQFMSISLSYFSSLNMLKQMREINTDTTSMAVSSSADTAAAAAAAAAAANIPAIRQMKLGATDAIDASIAQKEAELHHSRQREDDAKKAKEEPFPKEVRFWSVADVGRWLQTLSLHQYVDAFKEACVDGDFLLELREEDMSTVLQVEHRLHRRKILLAREKLKPLTIKEMEVKKTVEHEEVANKRRIAPDVPDLNLVFSQCRHGRLKRVEESLRLGFDVNSEDEKGNTLLLVSCQNGHRKMLDLLLNRMANINHQNSNGNTALHYALAFDTSGEIAEFLIEKGADDGLENKFGLSPYDGLGESGM